MFSSGSPIPRPEYPRPDKQRGCIEGVDWLNLNGPWQFRFDAQRAGLNEAWPAPGGPDWREQIIVPFCWESLAAWGEGAAASNDHFYSNRVFCDPSGVTRENHRSAKRFEVGWYRRLVEIPATEPWLGKRVIMTIGAADFFTDCWCNGVHLGRHEGGYVPFEFDLTETLAAPSQNEARTALIVLRVEDPMDNSEQPVGKQRGWYTTTSGIWQTVFIEPRSAAHIESFRIFPDIDKGRVSFEVLCAGTTGDAEVAIDITPPEGAPQTIQLVGKGNMAKGGAELNPLVLWDPNHPRLYQIQLRLSHAEGQADDEVRSYFGMRKISTAPSDDADAPGMLCLNNQPIYLRGALYQSYHPDGVYTAGEASTLRNDIAHAREQGFDLLRVHLKLDDPILLYYADTLGIMLMQDFPNFGEGGDTPLGRGRFEEMMRLGIQRDFNHPSIIAWCLFNESWGFGGQNEIMKWFTPQTTVETVGQETAKFANSSSFIWIHQTWLLAKSLDPTRLIEDMSVVVWDHLVAYGHVETDINSWHFYINNYERARDHIANVVAQSYRGSKFNYIEGFAQTNAPLMNSEYGGVGALDGDRDVSWSFKFLTNELRLHGRLSAYIYTELTDVEWEHNGFLNYDRTRKEFGYVPTLVNQGDVLPIKAPPISRRALGEIIEVEVFSSHFSRRRHENITFHWLFSGMDTLGHCHPQLARGNLAIPFGHHRVELVKRLPLTMPAEPMLCTLAVAAVNPAGQTIACNFVQYLACTEAPPEREDRGHSLILRRRASSWNAAEWNGGHGTPEEAARSGSCYGVGAGFFEWNFSDEALRQLAHARRVELLLELSARKEGISQTDSYRHPTCFEILLNGLPVHRSALPDHPHDARGALSYLRGDPGAYGYLVRATVENGLLAALAATAAEGGIVSLRCAVREAPLGGLTVYDWDCGRLPIGLTLAIEWGQTQK
jgi:Glycosyl hydrolases family 2, sugar binding domain/Glycosyl hydrolases family 2/Glycosyl hydrolases family 2, TIM barrel domain